MSTTSVRREQVAASLRDKEYRSALGTEGIDEHIPAQIRAMRQARGWSQKELAERLGMTQHGVSRLENPNYGKFTLATLKRLVPVFDVALVVKYVPFSQLVDELANLSPDDLAVPDYEHDLGLHPASGIDLTTLTSERGDDSTFGKILRFPPGGRSGLSLNYGGNNSYAREFTSPGDPYGMFANAQSDMPLIVER